MLPAAIATAAPAAAADDTTRPDARVTHGPSCDPGGLVVEVVAGTLPYSVRLASTRTPAGEAEAVLEPGESVVLSTADVAPGETIDARLEYEARDGSGATSVDELDDWTFTRPTEQDCAAVGSPPPPPPAPPTTDAPTPEAPATPPTTVPPTTPADPGGTSSPGTTPAPPTPEPDPPAPPAPSDEPSSSAPAPPPSTDEARPAEEVAPGGALTVEVSGFQPGEPVTIGLAGSDLVIGAATAEADGTVTTEVRIPAEATPGPAALAVVGDRSAAVADVPVQVAAHVVEQPASGALGVVPLVLAAGALVTTAGALVPVAERQRRQRRSARS